MEVPLCMKTGNNVNANNDKSKYKSLSNYKVLKEIGEGSFSIVYHAKDKECQDRDVAIKMCIKKQIIKEKMVKYVHREKEALAILSTSDNQHPAIVKLYATFQDTENLYFVLSFGPNGDLLSLMLKKMDKKFSLDESRYYSGVLLTALAHIHSLGIVHRDVKPENILVKSDGRIMLSDFGSSAFVKDYDNNEQEPSSANKRRASFVGTAQYVSPEMLTGDKITSSCDMWSFGVVLYQFLTGLHAFHDESEYLIFRRVKDLLFKFPDKFEPVAKDLINKLLIIEPLTRLKSSEVRTHEFFDSIDFENINKIEPPKLFSE